MTARELDALRAQTAALRDTALAVVQQATAILAALPDDPAPPKAQQPADSLDGISFAGGGR